MDHRRDPQFGRDQRGRGLEGVVDQQVGAPAAGGLQQTVHGGAGDEREAVGRTVEDLVRGHVRGDVTHFLVRGLLEDVPDAAAVADLDDRETGLAELAEGLRAREQHLVAGGAQGLSGRNHREEVAGCGRSGEEYAHGFSLPSVYRSGRGMRARPGSLR